MSARLFLVSIVCILLHSCSPKPARFSPDYQQKFNYSEIVGSTDDPAHFPEPDRWAMHQFGIKGLNDHFMKTMEYPIEAVKAKKPGVVRIKFVVEADGRILRTEIISSSDPIFEREASRLVLTSGPWIPGLINNRPVRTLYELPIYFTP